VTKPYFVVLAGPNGVGKTTFAHANLGDLIEAGAFLNADDIARVINPSDLKRRWSRMRGVRRSSIASAGGGCRHV